MALLPKSRRFLVSQLDSLYLGHLISNKLEDDDDIARNRGSFRAGFKPDRSPFLKNVGAPPTHKFSDINMQKHSVDTCTHVRNIVAVI